MMPSLTPVEPPCFQWVYTDRTDWNLVNNSVEDAEDGTKPPPGGYNEEKCYPKRPGIDKVVECTLPGTSSPVKAILSEHTIKSFCNVLYRVEM